MFWAAMITEDASWRDRRQRSYQWLKRIDNMDGQMDAIMICWFQMEKKEKKKERKQLSSPTQTASIYGEKNYSVKKK